jgi:RNA recognition motif-containing protein
MSKVNSRVVFVGNIPYDFSETQVVEIFQEVGQVLGFRLVFDRDTAKPKGYGFCTYIDHETACSAVRNLNNFDVGGRQLRVDFADADKEVINTKDQKRNEVGIKWLTVGTTTLSTTDRRTDVPCCPSRTTRST